jgi:hypothetical protein
MLRDRAEQGCVARPSSCRIAVAHHHPIGPNYPLTGRRHMLLEGWFLQLLEATR